MVGFRLGWGQRQPQRQVCPSHHEPSYHLSSEKLGTGCGLSSGPSFPLEGEGSGEKGPFPDLAQAHPWWCRWELGKDLGLGSVSSSMELRELHASPLPGLQFSYSNAHQGPCPPPPPVLKFAMLIQLLGALRAGNWGRVGWGKPWWLEGLLFRGPGISGGLQRADPTSCPSVSELFEHRKSQLRRP